MPTTLSTFAIQTLSLVLFFLLPYHADAFKINPYAKYKNGKYVGGALSPEPVHENLTVHSLSQVSTMYLPQNTTSLRTELISGVRWNDDPLSMLKTRLINYAINFEHSCADSISPQIDPRWDYLYRTHCGDMQYLHAMASKPDEHYNDTLNKMMMWLEFTYKVSSNKISPSRRLRSVHELLSDTSRQLFYKHITNQGSKYRCALGKNGKENCAVVRTLFTLECHRALFHKLPKCKSNDSASPTTVMNIALGSGLHVLQDSLSDSHVARLGSPTDRCSPRKRKVGIIKFFNYREQNGSLHGEADLHICDKSDGDIDLIDIGTKFIEASLRDRKEGTDSWPEIEAYLRTTLFAAPPDTTSEQFTDKYKLQPTVD